MSELTLLIAPGHSGGYNAGVIKAWNFGARGNRHYSHLWNLGPGFPEGEGPPQYYNGPSSVQGSPYDDQITFVFERPIFFNIHSWYSGVFSFGVTQRRLMDGRLIVEAQRQGCFMRACWTIGDRYTPDEDLSGPRRANRLTESATGLMTISQYEQNQESEAVTMVLYRGDALYCKVHNELEDAVPDCDGGNGTTPPQPPAGGGGGIAQ